MYPQPMDNAHPEATATSAPIDVSGNHDRTLIDSPLGYGKMLTPYRPGQSGNPKGRPPDTERMLERLVRRHKGILDDAADALAEVLRDPKNRHWLGALREALDRTEGPVATQAHHHVSTDRAVVVHPTTSHAPELPDAKGPSSGETESDSTSPPTTLSQSSGPIGNPISGVPDEGGV